MDRRTLDEANALDKQIKKLEDEIEQLKRGRITISIHGVNGMGGYQFATIGTDEGCEHADAEAARQMLDELIARRNLALADAKRQLADL